MVSNDRPPISKDIISAPDGINQDSEFSYIITLADIALEHPPITLTANKEECSLLAMRFDLPAIHSLSANVQMHDEPISLKGRFSAKIEQICVASGRHIENIIEENIDIKFINTPNNSPNDELELDDSDCDIMFHNGRDIDIGEAISQSLYLALDPFPRIADADAILTKAGVINEDDMQAIQRKESPFNALSALKR